MSLPSDFDKRTTVTIGLLIWIAIVSFSLGMGYSKVNDAVKEREELKTHLEGEIEGLRSDWDRRYDETINPRLKKLEK